MTGTKRARTVAAVVALALAAAATACGDDGGAAGEAAATTTASTTDPTTATVAAQDGPTVGPDGRLVPGACASGAANEDPDLGVTEAAVNVAWVSVDFTALKAIGFAATDLDLGVAMAPLVDALNAAGGVCGRTIDYAPLQYDILKNEGGAACVKVTEDRRNALVLGQGGFTEAPCVAQAGTLIISQQDFSEVDVEAAGGADQIFFVNPPSNDQAYRTSTELFLPSLEGKKVGVWYGSIAAAQGDAVEAIVLPMLDDAGIDYTAYRTDYQGPNVPEGQAALSAAATDFVSKKVDVVFNFTQTTNHVGLQAEMAAQGHIPTWLSANIGANTANELFAKAYSVQAIADGERMATYAMPPTDVADEAWAQSCNEDLQAAGIEAWDPGTFEFAALANTCAQFDLLVALLTAVGPEITQAKMIAALESMPPFPMQNGLTPRYWEPGARFATHDMTGLVYDGASNTYSIDGDLIPIK